LNSDGLDFCSTARFDAGIGDAAATLSDPSATCHRLLKRGLLLVGALLHITPIFDAIICVASIVARVVWPSEGRRRIADVTTAAAPKANASIHSFRI
jgi:hypothetical protein